MHHTTEAQKANPFLDKPNKKTKKEYREWCVLEFEIDMQQDKGGSSEEIMKQNQDRRLKPMEGENQNQQQHHQPQKCPRCESLNTKFCYYNNYSLSQPRYFCKTCRRYWTQGGTLRNVPVGGGCRKGKKAKSSTNASSSSENSSRSQSQNTNSGNTTASPVLISKDQSGNLVSPHHPGISSLGPPPYYSGGGFLGSLAAIQSLNNQPPSQSFSLNLPVNLGGGDLGGPSNLSLLHGFDTIPSFGSQQQQQQQQQQQIQQQRQFYQMGNRDTKSSGDHSHFYSSSSNSQHQNWHHQAFINNTNPTTTVSDTALWSISTSTTTANTNSSRNNNNTGGSFPLNPADHHHHHQWHDLPGYGPPP